MAPARSTPKGGQRGRRWPLLVALLVGLPGLALGFLLDDYFHLLMLEQGGFRSALELFRFTGPQPALDGAHQPDNTFPWWTLPELKLNFLRPISGLSHWLDQRLFGRWPLPMHAHSLAWYLALVATVSAFLSRLLQPRVALLAAVLFALDETHALPVVWLANRNALIAMCLGLLGVLAHMRWQDEGWRPGALLAPLGLGGGLLAGEAGLGAFAYLLAHELCTRRESFRERARALAPACAVGIAWVSAYKWLGCGAEGSGTYVDPTRQPLEWLALAPQRLFAEAGSLYASAPIDLWMVIPQAQPALVLSGVLASLGIFALLRCAWPQLDSGARRGLRILTLGSVLSLLPVLSTFPSARLLLAASVGSAGLIAVLLLLAWQSGSRPLLRIGGAALFLAHVLSAPIGWGMHPWFLNQLDAGITAAALSLPLDPERVGDQQVAVLVPPDPVTPVYVGLLALHHGRPTPRAFWTLSMSSGTHRIERIAEDSFALSWPDGPALTSVYEQLFRGPAHPLLSGARIQREGFEVRILEDDGRWPTRASFHFERSLDHPDLVFLAWERGGFQPVVWPEVGGLLEFASQPGPMSSLLGED